MDEKTITSSLLRPAHRAADTAIVSSESRQAAIDHGIDEKLVEKYYQDNANHRRCPHLHPEKPKISDYRTPSVA